MIYISCTSWREIFKPFIAHNLIVKITIYTHTIDKFITKINKFKFNNLKVTLISLITKIFMAN